MRGRRSAGPRSRRRRARPAGGRFARPARAAASCASGPRSSASAPDRGQTPLWTWGQTPLWHLGSDPVLALRHLGGRSLALAFPHQPLDPERDRRRNAVRAVGLIPLQIQVADAGVVARSGRRSARPGGSSRSRASAMTSLRNTLPSGSKSTSLSAVPRERAERQVGAIQGARDQTIERIGNEVHGRHAHARRQRSRAAGPPPATARAGGESVSTCAPARARALPRSGSPRRRPAAAAARRAFWPRARSSAAAGSKAPSTASRTASWHNRATTAA